MPAKARRRPRRPREAPASRSRLANAIEQGGEEKTSAPQRAATAEVELLAFLVGEQRYAVPVGNVREVVSDQKVVPVPHTPAHIPGVFNRHGRVTAVLDLGSYCGEGARSQAERLVVLESGDLEAAVPVTEVAGLLTVGHETIQPPLPQTSTARGFVTGQIDQEAGVVLVVDVALLLEGGRHRHRREAAS